MLTLAVIAGCSTTATPASAIVNGQSALDQAFPWTVALVTNGATPVAGQFCGGTLIAPDRVLTATHCTFEPAGDGDESQPPQSLPPGAIDVLVGQTSLRAIECQGTCGDNGPTDFTPGVRIPVSQISRHPQTDVENLRYDVAILTLAVPVPVPLQAAIVSPVGPLGEMVAPPSDEHAPVDPLSDQATGWGVGTNTYAFGWGKKNRANYSQVTSSSLSWEWPDVMQWVGQPTGGPPMERQPDDYCQLRYGGEFHANDMFCAGIQPPVGDGSVKAPDSCNGDSGGPLLKKSLTPEPDPLNPRAPHQIFQTLQRDPANWRLVGVVSWGPAGSCGDPALPGVYARVGASSIYGYVTDTTPEPSPVLASPSERPTITGSYAAGGAITCNPGTWHNAGSFEYVMWRDVDDNKVRSGANETLIGNSSTGRYDVTAADVAGRTRGEPIGCIVTARGPGGYATAQASSLLDLNIPQPPQSPPPTTPEPAPAIDDIKPTVVRDFVICGVSSCKISVFATDTGQIASGLRKISASLVITRPIKCKRGTKKGKKCTKTVTKTVRLKADDELYSATIKKLRRSDVNKVRVRAYDRAGNSSGLLTLKLKLKKR